LNDRVNAQAGCSRTEIDALDREFSLLHSRWLALIAATSLDLLYRSPPQTAGAQMTPSVGETLLRSAAAVEQTFGGITANLWDDPFEWTLPENLSTYERVIEYLEEVEATRRRAFDSFSQDTDLLKQVLVPSGETKSLRSLLVDTLEKAVSIQSGAQEIRNLMAGISDG
jgi:hypothetical protein